MNNELIVATLWELVEKVQSQNYVKSVSKIDEKIVVEYKDGFKQRINLPITTLQEISKPIDTNLILKELEIVINSLVDEKYKILQQVLSEAICKLPTSKDADEELILTKLKKQIETLVLAIPAPKDGVDGKDADEQSIKDALFLELQNQITSFQTLLDLKITEGLQHIISVIPTPQDGINGKDADEEKILAALKIELNDSLKALTRQQEEALQAVATQKEELKSYLEEAIQAMPIPKNGIDGQDADSEAIKQAILEDIRVFLRDNAQVTKEELKLFIALGLEKRIANLENIITNNIILTEKERQKRELEEVKKVLFD